MEPKLCIPQPTSRAAAHAMLRPLMPFQSTEAQLLQVKRHQLFHHYWVPTGTVIIKALKIKKNREGF